MEKMREERGIRMRYLIQKVGVGLVVCVCCILCRTMTVQAAYKFVYVNGVFLVNSGVVQDTTVVSDGKGGTASYDAATNTLTLNNFTTSSPIATNRMGDLKIVLKGVNSILGDIECGFEDSLTSKLTFKGGGTLNMNVGKMHADGGGAGIEQTNNSNTPVELVIDNCTMNIICTGTSILTTGNLTIKDSTVNVVTTGIYEDKDDYAPAPGIGANQKLIIDNSDLDITGDNHAIHFYDISVTEGSTITDKDGHALHVTRFRSPTSTETNEWYFYVYSSSDKELLTDYDDVSTRVIIKKPVKAETQIPAKPGTSTTITNQTCKVGAAYYKINLTKKTATYLKPSSKSRTTVTVPSTVKVSGKTYKVTAIASKACKNMTKLKKVKIGKYTQTIGSYAFYGCRKLTGITFGTSVTTIGSKAFANCTALKKVTLPSKLKKINTYAFYGCKKLAVVTIKGTKLTNVGKRAFYKTASKVKVTVPKSKYTRYKKLLKSKGFKKIVYIRR